MTRPNTRRFALRGTRLPVLAGLLVFGVSVFSACGQDIFAVDWEEAPDTVVLYSMARPELNLASGFDFYGRRSVTVEDAEATGNWDMALDTQGGRLVLLPPGALSIGSKAQVASLEGQRFADVTEAPADTALYVSRQPVPVVAGTVYVWRTRQGIGSFGRVCVYYAKMEALDVDVAGGTLTFMFDASPVCNDRSLIPPK